MFKNQPKGLYALALANTGERFGYYTMIAVFALFLRENFGLDPGKAGLIYSSFLMLVYFLPVIGGILADIFGYGKMVTSGILIMFFGYVALSVPLGGDTVALWAMMGALLLVSLGTGLFKGNLQVMVGNLYDDPKYSDRRDAAFSIFYMAINIGAMFAPTAAVKIMEYAQNSLGVSKADSYHFAFGVACASLILSIIIYYAFRSTFKHVEKSAISSKKENKEAAAAAELAPGETVKRVVALILVFIVVIFFWMAFHQNGLTLTFFANEFTAKSSSGLQSMAFDVWNLVLCILIVYAGFTIYDTKSNRTRGIAGGVIAACLGILIYRYCNLDGSINIEAPIFQQFNPCFVVALTPVSLALFGWLAKKGKEPSAPRKIALGMLVAASAFLIMIIGSLGLPSPDEQAKLGSVATLVSPNWLISTYLVLTFGELLLSPMGISFVTKVAPPKLKGLMMGGWFASTAIGNFLVSVGGYLWGGLPLWVVWSVFIGVCVVSALFMFIMMKRLEKVAK
ncbi:MAG: peptide MFS transporter [Muribaculaceae bacterium]|nr:peptide MFS transporter [Muribaculaceae bacterium]